ncbi:MAG TPA: hypothetical protein VFF30_13780 [Nitrososphaerales archaeon]|nr:hypothetical protein [Nitrososphaerales archaeon]
MNLNEYAWGTTLSISQKKADEIKLLFQDDGYPKLERDSVGYVLRIPTPKQARENVLSLHGMYFDNDDSGKSALWQVFNASLHHLALHSVVTDYSIYRDISPGRGGLNNLMFAISLTEDFAARGLMRAKFPGLLSTMAYANHYAYLRFKDLSERGDIADLFAADLFSLSLVGRLRVPLGEQIDKELTALHKELCSLEELSHDIFSHPIEKSQEKGKDPLQEFWGNSLTLSKLKVQIAELICSTFNRNSVRLSMVHSLPHTESHSGTNYLFEKSAITESPEERERVLELCCKQLGINPEGKSDVATGREILDSWLELLAANQRMIALYRKLDPTSHIENYTMPAEDYAEFVRVRAKLVGPIRSILEQLRQMKTDVDERQNEEAGYIDMQKAIQYVASKNTSNDYFAREEIEKKSEAWAIIIDASKSLEQLQGKVKDIAVCIMEVAKDLFTTPEAWCCLAFNENLFIIKDFKENYSNTVKSRAGGLSSGIKTYLPDALRIAASRLSSMTAEVKAILVISDGYPLGYEGIEKELITTIEKVNKKGILLLGLGVGSSAIQRYFRLNCVINQPSDLMKQFVKTYLDVPGLL